MEANITMTISEIERALFDFNGSFTQPYNGEDYEMLKFLESLSLIKVTYPGSDGQPYVTKSKYCYEIIQAYAVKRGVEKMTAANIL